MISGGTAGKVYEIDPGKIVLGQLPASQFPRGVHRLVRGGEWDREVIPIEEHSVYRSMVAHFENGVPWEDTPHFREAVEAIRTGESFRGAQSIQAILPFFEEWDRLYQDIQSNGFMSMKELQRRRLIDNPCKRLDEITVNLSRDGNPLLNDGWHRFCIARILGISPLPVRILARHQCYPQWTPSSSP